MKIICTVIIMIRSTISVTAAAAAAAMVAIGYNKHTVAIPLQLQR